MLDRTGGGNVVIQSPSYILRMRSLRHELLVVIDARQ